MNQTARDLLLAAKMRANVIASTCEADDAIPALEELGAHVMRRIEELTQQRQFHRAHEELFG